MIQEYIPGVAASASVISTQNKASTLTLNEQLLGSDFLGPKEKFEYWGNIVPLNLNDTTTLLCEKMVEKIVSHFGLLGSNGVDFVISRNSVPNIIEVNPRFQGTLECVEKVLGFNLVKMHIDAIYNNILPKIAKDKRIYCSRIILCAPYRLIAPDLTKCTFIRDIPLTGTIIEKGEFLCSIVVEAKSKSLSLKKAKKAAEILKKHVKPVH
jgi:predicted ATP-grasp superfamily ATP-dependent carboligase